MKLLIGYATSEGQTRKIARHIADRAVDHGHAVELLALADADDISLSRFDAILLAASVHVSHYPKAFSQFVSDHADELGKANARFLSVSLAAAGHDAEDWRGLDQIVADFTAATGWTPSETKHIAGAYCPSHYDPVTGFVMRRIIAKKDPGADPKTDKEYTDWADLDGWVDRWAGQAGA